MKKQTRLAIIGLSLAFAAPATATILVVDDFSTYGSTLTSGDTTNAGVYSWNVFNHVTSGNSIPITAQGMEIAKNHPGHNNNLTAEADLVFAASSRPILEGAELTFNIFQRHEFTEFEVRTLGNATSAKFTFSNTGLARYVFTSTGIDEYINGGFLASRSYASLGWSATDQITSLDFTGLHHDNGSIDQSHVDNVSFSGAAVPEPSSTMLMGIAGGLLLWRRKR